MKTKAIKITTYGSGAGELSLIGIRPANDHVSWVWSISSTMSDNLRIWGVKIFDSRYGSDRQGKAVYKLNLYRGLGTIGTNNLLTLTGPISSFHEHHSETPHDPYILLS